VPRAGYEFTVTVTNSVGGYGRASVTTKASSAPIPLISISVSPGQNRVRQLRATAGQAVVIDSSLLPDLPSFETAPLNPPSPTLIWTQTSGAERNSNVLGAQKTPSRAFSGGILAANQEYALQLTTELPGFPELTVSDTVDVYIGMPSLEDLEFTRGLNQPLPFDQPLNLSVNSARTTAVSSQMRSMVEHHQQAVIKLQFREKASLHVKFNRLQPSNPTEKALPESKHHPSPASPIAGHLYPFAET
jgi:hypothetical protein